MSLALLLLLLPPALLPNSFLPALGPAPAFPCPPTALLAPDQQLAGLVMAPDSTPLAGVSMLVRGIMLGTTTNAEGRFLLVVRALPCTLELSLGGYASKELVVTEAADLQAPLVLRPVRAVPTRPAPKKPRSRPAD